MSDLTDSFWYEHIGHMQFSTLTLTALRALQEVSSDAVGVYSDWQSVSRLIEQRQFSKRQADGELERFCYGYECLDRFDADGAHQIALTSTGLDFLRSLVVESPYQPCQIALLVRPAKRKQHSFNITVQETTFFLPTVYQVIEDFNFRAGGAREFFKCLDRDNLIHFLDQACLKLSPTPIAHAGTLQSSIEMVERYGKYWAAVGGRYSWFVFPQRFSLAFQPDDWRCYDLLMNQLVRPPEWGGGYALPFVEIARLLQGEDRLRGFWQAGIIRPIGKSARLIESDFCLTSPGYLMWERKAKGFLCEFRIRRLTQRSFEVALCDAADLPERVVERLSGFSRSGQLPTFRLAGELDTVLQAVAEFLKEMCHVRLDAVQPSIL